MSDIEEDDDDYYCFGNLQIFEAKEMLARLEVKNVRFQIEADTESLGVSPPLSTHRRLGVSHVITLYIHREDEAAFREVYGEFFKV